MVDYQPRDPVSFRFLVPTLLIIAVLAAALNYVIGRWWLHESIGRRLSEAGEQNRATWVRAIRDVATEAGFRVHFLIRLTPIPTTIISYVMGASGGKVRPFLLAAAVAVIPQALWVYSGTAATLINDPRASTLRWGSIVVSVTAAIAIGVIVPRMAMKHARAMKRLQTL